MQPTIKAPTNQRARLKLGAVATILLLAAAGYWRWGDQLTLDALARQERQLRTFYDERPLLALTTAFAAYVIVCGLAIPGAATALTLLFGWLFGFWRAVLVVSFASASGASLAFLLSRYLLRDWFEVWFRQRLGTVQQTIARDGAFYLLLMRLSPLVPFYLINVLMGLTTLRLTTFWWVSQLGMLPATCLYVYAGASVPSLEQLAAQGLLGVLSPQLVIALTALGLFPLAMKKFVERWKPRGMDGQSRPENRK